MPSQPFEPTPFSKPHPRLNYKVERQIFNSDGFLFGNDRDIR
jgi:hypothetical protein